MKRVGKKRDILRTEIIVAVVAQAVCHTVACHRKRVVANDSVKFHILVALHIAVEHHVELRRVRQIYNLGYALWRRQTHIVVYACLAAVFLAVFQVVGRG